MNILYFTKPKSISLKCLEYMIDTAESDSISVVFSNAQLYRGDEFISYCIRHNIDILDEREVYQKCNDVDVIITNTFPKRIRSDLLNIVRKYAINFHSAPLPQYRGVFGYNFAVFNEEKEFGVTAHYLTDEFDCGSIIEIERFPIDSKTISIEELVELSNEHLYSLFTRVYDKIIAGKELESIPQNEENSMYYSRKDFEELKRVTINDKQDVIDKKIRACFYPPYEGAFIELDGKRYSLF